MTAGPPPVPTAAWYRSAPASVSEPTSLSLVVKKTLVPSEVMPAKRTPVVEVGARSTEAAVVPMCMYGCQ